MNDSTHTRTQTKKEYSSPALLQLGSSAAMTSGGTTVQSESGEQADSAFPNPAEGS